MAAADLAAQVLHGSALPLRVHRPEHRYAIPVRTLHPGPQGTVAVPVGRIFVAVVQAPGVQPQSVADVVVLAAPPGDVRHRRAPPPPRAAARTRRRRTDRSVAHGVGSAYSRSAAQSRARCRACTCADSGLPPRPRPAWDPGYVRAVRGPHARRRSRATARPRQPQPTAGAARRTHAIAPPARPVPAASVSPTATTRARSRRGSIPPGAVPGARAAGRGALRARFDSVCLVMICASSEGMCGTESGHGSGMCAVTLHAWGRSPCSRSRLRTYGEGQGGRTDAQYELRRSPGGRAGHNSTGGTLICTEH